MDPGIDDALALILGLHRLHVLGVTTVAGNVEVQQTYQNAHRILHVAGREEVPVLAGADRPLCHPLLKAEDIHGFSGMDGFPWDLGPVAKPGQPAWQWMADQVDAHPHTLHLIATGPMTNLALWCLCYPGQVHLLESVTCMAGALPGTKMDKTHEFNIYVDPHAADIVFRQAVNLSIIGINVTHRALVPIADLRRLSDFGRVGEMLAALLTFYARHARGEGGDPNAIPIDDAVAVAAVDVPEIFQWTSLPLTVVREGELRGTVVVAPFGSDRPDVRIAREIDVPAFLEWLWHSLESGVLSAR